MTDWYDSATLPKFERPPVVETALAVEFAPIAGMDPFRLNRLQSSWEDEYPVLSEAPGSPPTPPASDGTQPGQIFMGDVRRMWAGGVENGLLVQTQADRLILNWRKTDESIAYPGFDFLGDEYQRLWNKLNAFVDSSSLDSPLPILAEYTYVNAVPLDPDDSTHDVVTLITDPEAALPGRDLFTRFQFIRNIEESPEHPFAAEIHILGQPQLFNNARHLVFTVVARVLLGQRANDPLRGLSAAHALASHTFARIVTPEKQSQWGRIQ